MDTSSPKAWQPLTPHGVAAFAQAPLRRLLLVQLVVALVVALAVAWFCHDRYVPPISMAITQLPDQGQIRGQQLDWTGPSPITLAENHFLALSVDLERSGGLRSVADVQLEFGRQGAVIHSLFGYAVVPYPPGWIIALNREVLQPLWGAWRPVLLAGVVILVMLGLFISWFALATAYAFPVWWFGRRMKRQLNWRGSWRLSGAALLPGALLMLAGLSFYDLGMMDLVPLTFVFGVHFLVGWVYLALGVMVISRGTGKAPAPKNPFAAPGRK